MFVDRQAGIRMGERYGGILSQQQPPAGILGWLQSPQAQGLAQGLLEASAPSRIPVGFGQALNLGLRRGEEIQNNERNQYMQDLKLRMMMEDMERKKQSEAQRQEMLSKVLGGESSQGALDPASLATAGLMTGDSDMLAYAKFMQDSAKENQKMKIEQGKYDTEQKDRRIAAQNDIEKSQQAINLIDKMVGSKDGATKEHPGFRSMVGSKNIFSGAINSYNPFASTDPQTGTAAPVPGSDAAGFAELLKQVKGTQFLEAFNSLKGGGHITEIEGARATQAISRMSAAQSEAEFIEAAREFQDIMKTGIERARQKGGLIDSRPPLPGATPATNGWVIEEVQ